MNGWVCLPGGGAKTGRAGTSAEGSTTAWGLLVDSLHVGDWLTRVLAHLEWVEVRWSLDGGSAAAIALPPVKAWNPRSMK